MSLTALRELMVLSAVRAHAAHGYAIAELLERGLGPTLGLTRPTVYATLRRFERRGWVRSEVVRDSNYPEREVYHLVGEGHDAYHRLLTASAANVPDTITPLVALLAHVDDLPEPELRASLGRIRSSRAELIEQLAGLAAHEGAAGVAVRLLLEHLRLDVAAVEGLLASR